MPAKPLTPGDPFTLYGQNGFKEESSSSAQRQQVFRRSRRLKQYEQVRELFHLGYSLRAIAQKLNLDRRTVLKYVHSPTFPEIARRTRRTCLLDPYQFDLLKRWEQGCHTAAHLFRELKKKGDRGGVTSVRRFVQSLRKANLGHG